MMMVDGDKILSSKHFTKFISANFACKATYIILSKIVPFFFTLNSLGFSSSQIDPRGSSQEFVAVLLAFRQANTIN